MDAHDLDLLGHAVEVDERSGGERDVGVEEKTLGSSIDRAENCSVQREAEGQLVTVLGVGQNILGVDPVLGSLGQQVGVLGQFAALQVSGVCAGQTEGDAANVGGLRLHDSHHQALPGL